MTTYGAYDAGLPCKNTACKSHGRSHPNCRCYPNLAGGGDVNFCSETRSHQAGCEYFADGGLSGQPVPPENLPEDNDLASSMAPGQPGLNVFSPQEDQFKPVPPENLPDDLRPSGIVPESNLPDYSTPNQRLGSMVEGAAQGVIPFGLSTLAETKLLGIPAGDIVGREQANQQEHDLAKIAGLVGGAFIPIGDVAIADSLAIKAAEFAGLGKIGSAMIRGFISNGLIQGGDEISKGLLGEGDPQHPVGAALIDMGAAGLLGLGFMGVNAAAEVGLKKAFEGKIGNKIMTYLAGIASGAQNPAGEREVVDTSMKSLLDQSKEPLFTTYQAGQQLFDSKMGGLLKGAAPSAGAYVGGSVAGTPGAAIGWELGKKFSKPIEGALEKIATPAARKFITPVVLKILSSNNSSGILEALGHADHVATGFNQLGKGIDALFKSGVNFGVNDYGSPKLREKLDKHVEDGGHNQDVQQMIYDQNDAEQPQGFAKGGEVKPKLEDSAGLGIHYPDQNILLQAAKGRISSYLMSLKPRTEHQPRLAFDDEPDVRQATKSYHRALDIAAKPLGIIEEVKRGTIESEHVKHFNAMYPEINLLLQKKLTERITKDQIAGKKPSYKIRQGLSMLMGAALSSELTPAGIQAAQATFLQRQAQQQPEQSAPSKPKKTTTSLSKSDSAYLTGSQALQRRSQKT